MKRILILLNLVAGLTAANAQTTGSIGVYTGANSTNSLFSTSTTGNLYSRTLSIYTAAEIAAAGGMAGNIVSLDWDKRGTGEYTSNNGQLKVFIKSTSASTWSAVPSWDTEALTATQVFSSTTYSFPTGTGWMNLPLQNSFQWNGTDNIIVMAEFYRPSPVTGGSIDWGRSSDAGANATRVGSTSLSALVMLINANRPLLRLTFQNTPIAPVTDVTVSTQGSVPAAITTNAGTLQMEASVTPSSASQNVTWSVAPVTGSATISASGLITATGNGTVWASATSVQNPAISDSMLVTISGQLVPVTGIDVTTQGAVPSTINGPGGTLQLNATILPSTANQSVTWSIVPQTGTATIAATGLVTAQTDGNVWAKATSVQDNTFSDSILVVISNQTAPVTAVNVSTQNGAPAMIDVNAGTLQLVATVLPANADQNVAWSITAGSGSATISSMGLVTAQTNGNVWAKAISTENNNISDSIQITITGQGVGIRNTINDEKLEIYPNPVTTGAIHIKLAPGFTANKQINYRVVDVTGKTMVQGDIKHDRSVIEVSNWPVGSYFLKLEGEEIKTQRTVIVK